MVTRDSEPVPTNAKRFSSQRPRKSGPRPASPLSYFTDDEPTGPRGKNKDDLANKAESRWPSRTRVVYKDGIKLRQQNPVIRTIIAETIQRCEVHMISVDAFPETGQRVEFRYTVAKQAIKALYLEMGGNTGYQDAFNRAREDTDFVQRLGELVCLVLSLRTFY